MRKCMIILTVVMLIGGCGGTAINADIPFDGAEADACGHFVDYLSHVANGEHEQAFEYEDYSLWPSLVKDRYLELRTLYPEFSSLLSKSTVRFTQCVEQQQWGIYGNTFEDTFMIAFEVDTPESLTPEEEVFSEILSSRDNVTVMITIDGKPKFLPCIGPELYQIDEAIKTYRNYVSVLKNAEYSRIYDFETSAVMENVTREQIQLDWDSDIGREVTELVGLVNPEPIGGRIVFQPSAMGVNYRWGVYVYVVMDTDFIDTESLTDIQRVIIDDWQQGTNTKVLMVPENGEWKVYAENPLL